MFFCAFLLPPKNIKYFFLRLKLKQGKIFQGRKQVFAVLLSDKFIPSQELGDLGKKKSSGNSFQIRLGYHS